MNRPYIICYMLQSSNESITGRFYEDEKQIYFLKNYAKMSGNFDDDGIIYGSITAKGLFGLNVLNQDYSDTKEFIKRDDFVVQNVKMSLLFY